MGGSRCWWVTSLAGFVAAQPWSHSCHVQSSAATHPVPTLAPLPGREPSRGHGEHRTSRTCPGCPHALRSGSEGPWPGAGPGDAAVSLKEEPQRGERARSRIPAPNKALLCSCFEQPGGLPAALLWGLLPLFPGLSCCRSLTSRASPSPHFHPSAAAPSAPSLSSSPLASSPCKC